MNEIEATSVQSTGSGGGTQGLFLALYLLILAFFILLVSISTLEEVKAKAAINSVTATFSNILPPTVDITSFSTDDADVLAGQAFQEEITGIFATTFQVAKVEVIQPGRLMRVVVPTEVLFVPASAEIKPAQFPFLDRLVASLSGRPEHLRYDMEFVIGSNYAGGKSLPIGQTLEMARGGAFVRQLHGRGAPPDSISIGLKAGDPGEVVLWFYIRGREESRLIFINKEGGE